MSEKMSWFFGTKNPQKGEVYDCLVAEKVKNNEIILKEFQIPRIEFQFFTMYDDYAGQQIFSVYPKPKVEIHLNKLRPFKADAILLGVAKPRKNKPYVGFLVSAINGEIQIVKRTTWPLKEIVMPYVSRIQCNKQFFVVKDQYNLKYLIEIVE